MEVRNRYSVLQNEDNDDTATYDKFVQANTGVTEMMIPQKKRTKVNSTSKHPRIIAAREQVQNSFEHYQRNSNRYREKVWKESTQKLQKAYTDIEEEEEHQQEALLDD